MSAVVPVEIIARKCSVGERSGFSGSSPSWTVERAGRIEDFFLTATAVSAEMASGALFRLSSKGSDVIFSRRGNLGLRPRCSGFVGLTEP